MNVLLVEDHPLFRFGVRQLITQHWPIARIREADSLAQALSMASRDEFDVAIVDLNLPDATGVESVAQLRRASPATRMLVLSLNQEAAYAQRVLKLGASAYLSKSHAAEELVGAIQKVLTGGRYITASLADFLAEIAASGSPSHTPHELLGPQEYRVMVLLASGQRVSDIATTMHLSPKTISTYRTRILEKMGLSSNIDIARYCEQHQLT